MADYSDDIVSAYNDIAEDGGIIKFNRPSDAEPTDPALPWEGNDEPPTPFEHVAALFPLSQANKQNAESNHRVLIPAYNLPFEITMDTEFSDTVGRKYTITAISYLAPDPAQVVLYDCECALWPTAS